MQPSNKPANSTFKTGKSSKTRTTTLRMKSFHKSRPSTSVKDEGIDDRAPFAHLDASASRDSNPKVDDLLQESGGGGAAPRDTIAVTTRIEQAVDKYPMGYQEDGDSRV